MSARFEELAWAPTTMGELSLRRRIDPRLGMEVFEVRLGDEYLMSSLFTLGETELARLGLAAATGDSLDVLVGGLGLGYTLRRVLDTVSEEAEVTVAELVPELVEWNRKHLGALADHPLDDPRCRVVVGDVFDVIKRSPRAFDVILLDVDNGPQALAQAKNQRLYGNGGVRACHAALRPGGVVAVWSAGPNARYQRRLVSFAFQVDVLRVPARAGSRAHHVLFVAKRSDPG